MKKILLAMLAVIVSVSLNSNLFAHDMHMSGDEQIDSTAVKSKTQQFCPVMGGKIDTTLYYDYNGKRVYVCCKMCIKQLKNDPQKYIDKLEKSGVELKKVDNK